MKKKLVMFLILATMVAAVGCGKKEKPETELGGIDLSGTVNLSDESIASDVEEWYHSNSASGITLPEDGEYSTPDEMLDALYKNNQEEFQKMYGGQLLRMGVGKYAILSDYIKGFVGENAEVDNLDMAYVVFKGDDATLIYSNSKVLVGDEDGVAETMMRMQMMGSNVDDNTISEFEIKGETNRFNYYIDNGYDDEKNHCVVVLQDIGMEKYVQIQMWDNTGVEKTAEEIVKSYIWEY